VSHQQIIRAWKDEDYRNGLSDEQRAQLPAHPAGLGELADEELDLVTGGAYQYTWHPELSYACCPRTA
jgi:mersacidin/lichenicidin family type 2 lantibiotic